MTDSSRRTWWSILIAGVVILGLVGIGLVGGTAFFIYRHVRAEFIDTDTAESRIDVERERFAGQKPFVEINGDRETVIQRRALQPNAAARPLVTLRALAYDPTPRKLVNVSIPFWLLRVLPRGRISILDDSGIDFDTDRLRLTLSDLEALGPGLILDHRDPRGVQILVWTE
jgi:hypothetical protein